MSRAVMYLLFRPDSPNTSKILFIGYHKIFLDRRTLDELPYFFLLFSLLVAVRRMYCLDRIDRHRSHSALSYFERDFQFFLSKVCITAFLQNWLDLYLCSYYMSFYSLVSSNCYTRYVYCAPCIVQDPRHVGGSSIYDRAEKTVSISQGFPCCSDFGNLNNP